MAEKVMNRWIVVIGAVVIQLALGTLYSWSTMSKSLSPYMGIPKETTVYIFGVALISFAILMIFAGQIQIKIGPMKTAMLGGIILGIGVLLTAATAAAKNLTGVIITYGIIFGAGIGIAYVVPIATAQKWFPDKVGMITGIAVAGFGAGAFIFNYIIAGLFGDIETLDAGRVATTFIVLGLIMMGLIIGGALTMKAPPTAWKPEGWTAPAPKAGITGNDLTREEMIKTPSFWILWIMYTLSALAGLLVIGAYGSFATYKINSVAQYPAIAGVSIVLLGGISALFNGLGRIVWGKIADIITYRKALTAMLVVQSLCLFIYFFTKGSEPLFYIITCAIVFCFGGNLSLFPTSTKDLFGAKNFSNNYGIVFIAYGIAGFIGATMTQQLVEAFGGYLQLFVIVGFFSVISLVLSFILKAPNAKTN